ncbi:endospore germination permease [Bacillus sp. H-16]|uniref:GerAB/ArcD/ProY family transporter n=1 Tax=Alteribacter salitolerans TaxID=2912333 RepID=UPI0019630FA5|nr:endospore germination permease [Alteribacter salitolerans]MBM7095446.1 endospore germination permease [Alteribacter salitolerans]
MHGKNERINVFHTLALFITSIGLLNHVIILPPLVETAGRDGWISIILANAIALLWVYIIVFINKKSNQKNIYKWLIDHAGSVTANIVVFVLILFLLSLAAVTLNDLVTWTKVSYLPETPKLILVITYILLCFCTAVTNIRTLAILNILLLPIIIIFGIFVASVNIPVKDYSLLTPVLEHGFQPVIRGMIYPGAGLAELFLLLLIQHRVKFRYKYWQVALIVILLGGLSFGPLTGGIAAFGVEQMKQLRFPAYQQWGLVTMGRYIEHVDFLSIYQWLSGAFIRISLMLFIVVDLLDIKPGKNRVIGLAFLSVIIVCSLYLPFSDMQFIKFMQTYFLPFSLAFLFCSSLLLLMITLIKTKGGAKK